MEEPVVVHSEYEIKNPGRNSEGKCTSIPF